MKIVPVTDTPGLVRTIPMLEPALELKTDGYIVPRPPVKEFPAEFKKRRQPVERIKRPRPAPKPKAIIGPKCRWCGVTTNGAEYHTECLETKNRIAEAR